MFDQDRNERCAERRAQLLINAAVALNDLMLDALSDDELLTVALGRQDAAVADDAHECADALLEAAARRIEEQHDDTLEELICEKIPRRRIAGEVARRGLGGSWLPMEMGEAA